MVTFVHITDERNAKSIMTNGLALPKRGIKLRETEHFKYGVFALPVIQNYFLSHQWTRELKAAGFRTAVGVYFRVSENEVVWAGRYNMPKEMMSAAESAGQLLKDEILGFEVIIPRSILAKEIVKIRAISQVVGWRHFPEAHGRPPYCGCSYCQRGKMNSGKIREQYEQLQRSILSPYDVR